MPATPPTTPNSKDWSENADAPHSSGAYPPANRPIVEQMPMIENISPGYVGFARRSLVPSRQG
jgi:hypothetical protein